MNILSEAVICNWAPAGDRLIDRHMKEEIGAKIKIHEGLLLKNLVQFTSLIVKQSNFMVRFIVL